MKKIPIPHHLVNLFTGKDNITLDLGRVLWAVGTLVFFALSIHSVWHGNTFDPVAWGTGFGAVLAAGGMALWMKKDTEPTDIRFTKDGMTFSSNTSANTANT